MATVSTTKPPARAASRQVNSVFAVGLMMPCASTRVGSTVAAASATAAAVRIRRARREKELGADDLSSCMTVVRFARWSETKRRGANPPSAKVGAGATPSDAGTKGA
jgi:hypothetical protein